MYCIVLHCIAFKKYTLSNRMFLSRNYRLRVALPRGNLMFLKQIVACEAKLRYINTLLSLSFHRASSKKLNYVQLFDMEVVKAKCKISKVKQTKTLSLISIVHFLQTRLFTEKFSQTGTIYPGVFRGQAGYGLICALD